MSYSVRPMFKSQVYSVFSLNRIKNYVIRHTQTLITAVAVAIAVAGIERV